MKLNIGAFEPCTVAMGPGKRACLWVRGCSMRCKGCATPEFLENSPPTPESAQWLSAQIQTVAREHRLEGLSFSGGEPFDQAEALSNIAQNAKRIGLSVLAWSGYTLEFLESHRAPPGASDLLSQLDALIDGPYIETAPSILPYRGSANQRLHLFTSRYRVEDFHTSQLEARINTDGSLIVNGVASAETMRAILEMMRVP